MKTLKTIILGLAAVMIFGAASAKTPYTTAFEKITVKYALTAYVNAVANGQNAELTDVLDYDFKFSMLRGSSMLSFNKKQTLDFLQTTEDVKQDCKTTVAVTESNSDITVAKVTMKYPNFTRVNYVTMAFTTEGWKITNVYSVFK